MNMDRFLYRAWRDGQMWTPFSVLHGPGGDFPDGTILMQCTGLKDSEGSLIWESDIVQIWYPDDGVKYISPVMWKHGAWCIYHENRVDYETGERACVGFGYWTPEALKRVTVLGNIYEHPSLLEVEK